MKKMLADLYTQFELNLPFVSYRKPNKNKVKSIYQSDDIVHELNDFSEEGFVFAPFDSTQRTILIPFSKVNEVTFEPNVKVVTSEYKVSSSEDIVIQHEKLVNKTIEAIEDDGFQKIVISRKEEVTIDNTNPIVLFERLLNSYRNAFVYVWYHPKVGCWLGATPETLLQVNGTSFKTMSLAGTQNFTDKIKWDRKEQIEQQLVTDFITNCLETEKISFKVSAVRTIKAGNLGHLCTDISGRLNGNDLGKLIRKLHPTPAVCGIPKQKSENFIMQHEGYDRQFYTGYLGELNLKSIRKNNKRNIENHAYNFTKLSTDLFVNLRCVQLKNNIVSVYVGGGITRDSNANSEFLETVQKAKTMLSVLG